MEIYKKTPDKGDPSDILQVFQKNNLQIHCCRYWWLKNWEFKELSFPYWRIYHNSYEGAVLIYEGKEYALTPDKILMIAPNTSYATRMYDHKIPDIGYELKGGRVNAQIQQANTSRLQHILHLFIHFNLGIPYDNVNNGIFVYELNEHINEKLRVIKRHLNYEHTYFSFHCTLAIQSLITDLLSELDESKWKSVAKDYRILDVMNYIDSHISSELSNPILANKSQLATNAFTRLFTEEIGISPQKYVKKTRIDKACIMLHHSSMSIDEIAHKTGFADRYHFSRIFKQVTGISPAKYKKEFGMK